MTDEPRPTSAWPLTGVTCLARGPLGSEHFYAAGAVSGYGVLYETDYDHAAPLLNWRAITQDARSAAVGTIWALCVSIEPVKLIAASNRGMYWADIPVGGGAINWQLVDGLPGQDFGDVANAQGLRIAAASFGDGTAAGVFLLRWRDDLNAFVPDPPHPPLPPALLVSMRRTHLASSPGDSYRTIYLAAAGSDDLLAALMRSDDGGRTFASVPSVPNMATSQANRNLGIGCSPNDPRTVAVGMRRGPWISTDAGANWTEHGDSGSGAGQSPHLHPDMYTAVFDSSDLTSQTLWITSDGGVAWTDDLGKTWNSLTNRSLTDLEVNRPPHMAMAVSGVQHSYGTPTEGSVIVEVEMDFLVPDLVAISTQDNGILGFQGDRLDGWAEISQGGDGRSLDFLASGELVWGVNDESGFRASAWNGSEFGPARSLGLRPGSSAAGDPILSAVREAKVITNHERLWAFSLEPHRGSAQTLWALWSADGHDNWHWDSVKRPNARLQPINRPGPYRSLGSASGHSVFLAGIGGIDRMNPKTGESIPLAVAGSPPPWDDIQVAAIDDRRAVAVFNKGPFGYLVLTPPAGDPRMRPLTDLVEIRVRDPRPRLHCVEIDPGSRPLRMWVATQSQDGSRSQVYETGDEGMTWHELTGLPPVNASTLRLGPTISPKERYLYLATWGRSVFRINVNTPSRYQRLDGALGDPGRHARAQR